MDDVVSPLLTAAEADVAAGRAALALARAQIVFDAVGAASPLRARADSVRTAATAALGGAAAEAQPPDTVVQPLVDAAEQDSQRGQHALSIARCDFAMQRLPAGGALATRATALRQAAMRLLSASTIVQAPPPPVPGAYPPAVAQPGLMSAYGQPIVPSEPPPPRDPTRRGDGELVELYITASLYGIYTGFWIPFAAGLEGGSGRDAGPANVGYSLALLAGGGLFALGVAGLDSGDGLRTGVGPSISIGTRLGLLSGFLMWGAFDEVLAPTLVCPGGSSCAENRTGWTQRTAFPLAMGAGGMVIGAIVGYGLRPTTNQVRFVELQGGLWGTSFGLFLGLAATPQGNEPVGFGFTLGGLAAGVLATSIVGAAGIDMSQRRAWLITAGWAAGVGAAALVSLIVSAATAEFGAFPIVFGGIGAATSLGGLILAGLLSEGVDRGRTPPRTAEIDIRPTFGPLEGGGMAGVSGTF
jgi:hypothetical protein